MTAADLEAFRTRLKLNYVQLAADLEISRDRLRRMLSGAVPIPRHIALACTALAHGDRPMGDSK